jgi:hypothetical protein
MKIHQKNYAKLSLKLLFTFKITLKNENVNTIEKFLEIMPR